MRRTHLSICVDLSKGLDKLTRTEACSIGDGLIRLLLQAPFAAMTSQSSSVVVIGDPSVQGCQRNREEGVPGGIERPPHQELVH